MRHLEFIKGQESEGGRTLPLVVGGCGVVTSNMVCPKHCSEGLRITAPKSTCFCKLKKTGRNLLRSILTRWDAVRTNLETCIIPENVEAIISEIGDHGTKNVVWDRGLSKTQNYVGREFDFSEMPWICCIWFSGKCIQKLALCVCECVCVST